MKKDLPLTKAEKIILRIEGLTHRGEGVGRHQGLAVFVSGTAPGDLVLAGVEVLKKNYARARLLEVMERSPGRVEPGCAHYDSCGGCRLQHLDYAEQLRLKAGLVKDSLSRLAGLAGVPVRETLGMAHPWHYRNKAHFQVERQGGKYRLGFYEEGSHLLAAFFGGDGCPQAGCLLVDRELNQVASVVQELLNRHGIPADRGERGGRFFRHVVLRKGVATGEVMLVLVTAPGVWPGEDTFTGDLLALLPGLTSVVRNINGGPPGVVLGRKSRVLAGRDYITDSLEHLRLRISPASFYQVNPAQTLTLYRKAREYAGLTGNETVLDAYCGIGAIALFLAGQARKVLGLEVVPEALVDARRNASLNGLGNVEFIEGEVEKHLPALAAQGLRPEVVVLDPPRRGCGPEVLEAVTDMGVPRVVYVSCDPGTLARDLGYLVGRGYRVAEVQPVDMFPWTHHVECVVLITRV